MNKNRILILYDYFDPAYKAGGPIRSLVNLVKLMESEMEVFVLTTNQDHDGKLLDVEADSWQTYGQRSKVKYLSVNNKKYSSLKTILDEIKPRVVYINGLYSTVFMVFALMLLMGLSHIKTVIAPRGMLQQGALNIKPFKKKVYLNLLKLILLKKEQIRWHATDDQEIEDIRRYAPNDQVILAHNIPGFEDHVKFESERRVQFVSISLLERKKNHLAFLKALRQVEYDGNISYHIYGPKSDESYYVELENLIKKLPENIIVKLKGSIHPSQVANTLQKYKFYVLTSFGENFGHSIFEAFNQGVPVIISDQTPWRNLKEKKAGWDVELDDEHGLESAIMEAIEMDERSYKELQRGARRIAEAYMMENDFLAQYRELFS